MGCARIIAISEGWLPKGQGKGGEQGAGLARPSARLLRGFCVRPRSFCNRQTDFFAVLFMAQAGCFSCLCGRGSDYTVRATSRMPGFRAPARPTLSYQRAAARGRVDGRELISSERSKLGERSEHVSVLLVGGFVRHTCHINRRGTASGVEDTPPHPERTKGGL